MSDGFGAQARVLSVEVEMEVLLMIKWMSNSGLG